MTVYEQDLNSKEVEVMTFAKNGYSAKEISKHLNRTTRWVENQLMRAKAKLNARNIAHAVAIFVEKTTQQNLLENQ